MRQLFTKTLRIRNIKKRIFKKNTFLTKKKHKKQYKYEDVYRYLLYARRKKIILNIFLISVNFTNYWELGI